MQGGGKTEHGYGEKIYQPCAQGGTDQVRCVQTGEIFFALMTQQPVEQGKQGAGESAADHKPEKEQGYAGVNHELPKDRHNRQQKDQRTQADARNPPLRRWFKPVHRRRRDRHAGHVSGHCPAHAFVHIAVQALQHQKKNDVHRNGDQAVEGHDHQQAGGAAPA